MTAWVEKKRKSQKKAAEAVREPKVEPIEEAEVIEEKELSGEKLIKTVEYLIDNKPRLDKMISAAKKSAIIFML